MGCSSSDSSYRSTEQSIMPQNENQRHAAPVTERGVKLSYLLYLSTTFDDTMTISEIVDKVVRPRTEAHRCCMWEVLPLDRTGKPTYFISVSLSSLRRPQSLLLTSYNSLSTLGLEGSVIYSLSSPLTLALSTHLEAMRPHSHLTLLNLLPSFGWTFWL